MKTVEVQVQFQNVHARLAKESQVAALRMSLHKRAHVFFFHATRMSNTRNLEFCSGGRDIWVSTRPPGWYPVERDARTPHIPLPPLNVTPEPVEQNLVGKGGVCNNARCLILYST